MAARFRNHQAVLQIEADEASATKTDRHAENAARRQAVWERRLQSITESDRSTQMLAVDSRHTLMHGSSFAAPTWALRREPAPEPTAVIKNSDKRLMVVAEKRKEQEAIAALLKEEITLRRHEASERQAAVPAAFTTANQRKWGRMGTGPSEMVNDEWLSSSIPSSPPKLAQTFPLLHGKIPVRLKSIAKKKATECDDDTLSHVRLAKTLARQFLDRRREKSLKAVAQEKVNSQVLTTNVVASTRRDNFEGEK
jgi:hypothetical protein